MFKDNYKRYKFLQFITTIITLLVLITLIFALTAVFLRPQLEQSFYTLTRTVAQERILNTTSFIEQLEHQLAILATNTPFATSASFLDNTTVSNDITSLKQYHFMLNMLNDIKRNNPLISHATFKFANRDELIYASGDIFKSSHNDPFLKPALANKDYQLLYPAFYDLKDNLLVIGAKSPVYLEDVLVGYVTFLIKNTDFYNALASQNVSGERVYAFNDYGDIFFTNDEKFITLNQIQYIDASIKQELPQLIAKHEDATLETKLDKDTFLLFYRYFPDQDINFIIGLNKTKESREVIDATAKLAFAITVIVIAIFGVYTFKLKKYEKQFIIFSNQLKVVHKGIFHYLSLTSKNPYLDALYREYNAMLCHLGHLSTDLAKISQSTHLHVTRLNEEVSKHNGTITSISEAILEISNNNVSQRDAIENLDTLSKSIENKFTTLNQILYLTITKFDAIATRINTIEIVVCQDHHLAEQQYLMLTQDITDMSKLLTQAHQEMSYLIQMRIHIKKVLSHLATASEKNDAVSEAIKHSVVMQQKSLKHMSHIITRLYQTSLSLNNDISMLKIPLEEDKKNL